MAHPTDILDKGKMLDEKSRVNLWLRRQMQTARGQASCRNNENSSPLQTVGMLTHACVLPIEYFSVGRDALIQEIRHNDVTVLLGETGSGKTTRV